MQTKLQVEISQYSFLEIPIEADNINFILHEVDRINSIVDQHYEEKEKEGKQGKHPQWVKRALLLGIFIEGTFSGMLISRIFPQVVEFFFH